MTTGFCKQAASEFTKTFDTLLTKAIPYFATKLDVDAETIAEAFNSYPGNASSSVVKDVPATKCEKPKKNKDGGVDACGSRATKSVAINGAGKSKAYCDTHLSTAVKAAEKARPVPEVAKGKPKVDPKAKTEDSKAKEEKPKANETFNIEKLSTGLMCMKMPNGEKPPIKLAYDVEHKGIYGILSPDNKSATPLQPEHMAFAKSKKIKVLEDGPKLVTGKKPVKKLLPEPSVEENADDSKPDDDEAPDIDEQEDDAEAEPGTPIPADEDEGEDDEAAEDDEVADDDEGDVDEE